MSEVVGAETSAPRLRVLPMAFAAIGLTAILMVVRFPYDRLAQSIAQRIERETGARIALGPVSLGLAKEQPDLLDVTFTVSSFEPI